MRTIFVYHSIGDILFCEPIYRYFFAIDGVKPRVVVRDHLMWLAKYIESGDLYPISATTINPDTTEHNDQFINLRFANQIYRGLNPFDYSDIENCMLDKYRLLGISENAWKAIDLKINLAPSNNIEIWSKIKLQYNIQPVDLFSLVNCISQAGIIVFDSINKFSHKPIVQEFFNGVDLMQWASVMWLAQENHHVSTSTFFLAQAISNIHPNWESPFYVYPRPNWDGLRGISQLEPTFNLIRIND